MTLLYDCAGRVVVTGMGKSGLIARKVAATLSSTGTPALYLHPAEALHGDLGMIVRGDVVVAMSASGETDEILQLLATVKRLGVRLITMTCDDLYSPEQPAGGALLWSRRRMWRSIVRLRRSLFVWTGAHGVDDHHARTRGCACGGAVTKARVQGRGLRKPSSRRKAGQAADPGIGADA